MRTDIVAIRMKGADKGRLDTAAVLQLAATPTFAAMAMASGVFGGGAMDPVCGMAGISSPLEGMTSMYLLMAVFHLAPWLSLVAGLRTGR